jgi:hypothetical protein
MSKKHTLQSIIDLYKETFYIEDAAPIAIIMAIILSYRLKTPPVWLYLIGPSSGGKSQFIEIFSKVPFVTQVSDLTPNTFLSGANSGKKETSLLKKLGPSFVVTMKDFTTILSKPEEAQQAIVAQMREIYDGYITKFTGNGGDELYWGGDGKEHFDETGRSLGVRQKGKATFIMAATEAIFSAQDKFSDMGTRAINYVLKPQNRKATCRRALANNNILEEKVSELQDAVQEFVMDKLKNIPSMLPPVDDALGEELIDIADFSSTCRSVVKRDYRGIKSLALSAEMPMRMLKELLSLAQGFIYLNDGVLPDYLRDAVFKVALDSIPKQRRLILEVLAKYSKVNKAGIADKINYSPERTEEWIEDLNMFGVVERVRQGTKQSWRLKEEYRDIMRKYLGIVNTGSDLEIDDNGYATENAIPGNFQDIPLEEISWEAKEDQENQQKQADINFNNF